MDLKIDNQTVTLVDKVEMSILDYIKANKLVPNDTLPSETVLAAKLEVSRNVLREALSRLRMMGIIQSRAKRGIVIQRPSLLSGFEKVVKQIYLLGEQNIVDMMKMRIVLEVGITDFLFRNVTDPMVDELEEIFRLQESMKYLPTIEQEIAFHNKIYEISDNKFIFQLQQVSRSIIIFSIENHNDFFESVNKRLEREGIIVGHRDLFELIKNRDVEGYRNAIRLHLHPYMEFIYRKE